LRCGCLRELRVDMAQAEAFLVVAEELHFGRAADRLHVSQPRVSRLIAALERQVGGALLERTSRRVTLTPLGQQFRGELGAAYEQLQAAVDHARRAAREAAGQLRIGFTNTTEGPGDGPDDVEGVGAVECRFAEAGELVAVEGDVGGVAGVQRGVRGLDGCDGRLVAGSFFVEDEAAAGKLL
jgi:predicted DNA-binding protein (UPF0251 family)